MLTRRDGNAQLPAHVSGGGMAPSLRVPAKMRSQPEDGFTLVEMLVALIMVGLASAGALTLFVASFGSQRSERSHSQGVRIATGALDNVRAQDMCGLTMGTPSAPDVSYNGVVFKTVTTLSAVSADNPDVAMAPCSSPLSVVRARTSVSWSDQGKSASVTLATIVGRFTDEVVAGIPGGSAIPPTNAGTLSISGFSVSPLTINRTTTPVGRATQDDVLTVAGSGLAPTAVLTASYTDDDGAKSFTLVSSDGLIWRGNLIAGVLHRVIAASTTLPISVTAAAAAPAAGALPLVPEASLVVPLSITSASVNGGASITLTHVQNANHGGENASAIVLTSETAGLTVGDPSDYVKVSYPLATGTAAEIVLAPQPNGHWTGTIPAGSQKIAPGNTAFSFTVYRASDAQSALRVVTVQVVSS
jgi:prepilin-type N-terminal cleavage/methylation domain-containing protein